MDHKFAWEDAFFRRHPVIGGIVLVISVIGCVTSMVSQTTSLLGLAPLVLAVLLLGGLVLLAQRWVEAGRRQSPPAPPAMSSTAEDIWDAHRRRLEAERAAADRRATNRDANTPGSRQG